MPEPIIARLREALAETGQPLPLFREALAESRQLLRRRFHAGDDIEALVYRNADFMDDIMGLAWGRFKWHENLRSLRKSRVALIAVGGYGRRELLPHSDIDLLILLERNHHRQHKGNIQSFLTLLWDIGLKVGHSVRSISECRRQAAADVTVLTAMLESRTICGDGELGARLNRKIAPGKVWSVRAFFRAKRDEQHARHRKSDHTEYSLEPDVKISPGGLRDIQTLGWIAKRQYGAKTFAELVAKGILTATEADELTRGRSQLWRIRFALHLLAGRDENRLLFNHQQRLAALFGYEDGDQLAVEQFMQSYYRTAHSINAVSDILLQYFDEVLIRARKPRVVKPFNERFRLLDNFLEVVSEDVFEKHPFALIEMFTAVANDEKIRGIRASTIRLARQCVHLIDEDFRKDPRNAALFMTLLGGNNHLFTQLRRMGRYGILGAYLPEFGRVIGQMQFDLFHIYTVDAHLLQVVRNMRRFRYRNSQQEFPIAAHIHARLPRVELLYIAGLFHDIAKGMGGDHSRLGVRIAKDFCERHKLATRDTDLVCWLVGSHLVMSTTSQRKDIQNPDVIREFALFVGDQVRLDYLYALTVADINATNPKLWNGWRASLLNHLYSESKKVLKQGLENHMGRNEYVNDVQEQAIKRLVEHPIPREDITRLWKQVDDDYFMRESVADIIRQTRAIMNHDPGHGPLIIVRDDTSTRTDAGFTRIFIHTRDRKDLFVTIVTAIAELHLDIVDAGIATSGAGLTFNTFTVLEADGTAVGKDAARIDRIHSSIKASLSKGRVHFTSTRRTPRQLRQFPLKTAVTFRQDRNLPQTVLEVVTPDRTGLLVIIARVFVEHDISLVSARVTTLGERVEDLFYITDEKGRQIQDDIRLRKLQDKLCEELDQHVEKTAVG